MQSMTVHEIIDYHVYHLFPVLLEQVEAVVERAFATCFLQKNEFILSELNTAVAKDEDEKIRDNEAEFVICKAKSRTLKSESFVEKLVQRTVEEDNVVSSLAGKAKSHVEKTMDEWRSMTNLPKASPSYLNV